MASGTLFIVATPLGHLGDLSTRAAELFRTVDVVAAEDTRRIRGLLSHLGARPRVLSFHAHSSERRTRALLEILQGGRDIALVSDAGTPGVSDPGTVLVAAAREAGYRVVPVPGPSAVAAALSASGLPADRYLFLGFLPRGGRERARLLTAAASAPWTVVLFESPRRLAALLDDLVASAGPGRPAVVAREITKVHEEFCQGTLEELAARYREAPPLGEVTVVVAGRADAASPASGDGGGVEDAAARAAALLAEGMSRRSAAHQLAEELGMSRNEAYRLVTGLG